MIARRSTASSGPKYLQQGRGAEAGLVRIAPELRRVRDRFDVIFCRNVFIFFDRPTQEAVTEWLWRNLWPGCYFFVGHSESLPGRRLPLAALGGACYQKRADG
jgi:chemotaxis protein methyltransferase CheR